MENLWDGLPIVIYGTGATSKEAEHIIESINVNNHTPVFKLLGFVSNEQNREGVICNDKGIFDLSAKLAVLGVVIPFTDNNIKEKIWSEIKPVKSVVCPNIIHPSAKFIKSESIALGIGNIIEAGATINMNSKIGSFNLININSVIGHDTQIGDFCSVSPGAILSGNVTLGSHVLIGAGAVVKQNLTIGDYAVLGLGGFTVKDIESHKVMVCSQAQELVK